MARRRGAWHIQNVNAYRSRSWAGCNAAGVSPLLTYIQRGIAHWTATSEPALRPHHCSSWPSRHDLIPIQREQRQTITHSYAERWFFHWWLPRRDKYPCSPAAQYGGLTEAWGPRGMLTKRCGSRRSLRRDHIT